MGKDIVPVFRGEICLVKFNAQFLAYRLGICEIFHRGTVIRPVIFIPVLHEKALYLVAFFKAKQRSDRRIDATGHTNNNPGIARVG